MIESTLFGIIFGHQRRRILILKPSEYKVDNDSSAKVGGGETATYYKQKEKKGSQAGRRGGGGKLQNSEFQYMNKL